MDVYFNNTFPEFKILMEVIQTEKFNVDFHNKFINLDYFVSFLNFLHV